MFISLILLINLELTSNSRSDLEKEKNLYLKNTFSSSLVPLPFTEKLLLSASMSTPNFVLHLLL
jgi:hypothetical protein